MANFQPSKASSLFTPPVPDGFDAEINPFQVYPVRGLSDLRDLRAATVLTPEVQEVDRAVRVFAAGFMQRSEPPAKLLLAAKGDFGTGKTHLMLYARSVLAAELDDTAYAGPPVAVMAVCSEAQVEDWYASELGPVLIEAACPRELVRELLTRVACDVAEADSDPDVVALAERFRTSRKALYEIFRDPGEFDVSEVEARFSAEILTACPRTSRSFRRAIEALRWEETAELAEDWLAGNELAEADAARIGVRSEADRAARAAHAICAIASLSRRIGRPFALFLDEFEHLARFDHRNLSKRNITWTKRLVESLARRGAMVFISGHWEAWLQQGDFLDRFVGSRPIQLVRLNAEDVSKVVQVRAGSWPGFTATAADAVVRETAGNIRRVMTVLYDLWSDPSAPTGLVTPDAVRLAAQRRLQPGSESDVMPRIEAAVRASGAVLSRNVPFGQPPVVVDALVTMGSVVRLIVQIVHARDELALLDGGEKFARLVKQTRVSNPQVRGLCVTLGAVVPKHVLTLDAAFPETDLVNGEDPATIERLPELVANALAPVGPNLPSLPPPAAPAGASQEALENTRIGVVGRAEQQIARSHEVFGSDSRSSAVRQTSIADEDQLGFQRSEIARDRIFAAIMEGIRQGSNGAFVAALLRSPSVLAFMVVGIIVLTGAIFMMPSADYNGLAVPAAAVQGAAVPGDVAAYDRQLYLIYHYWVPRAAGVFGVVLFMVGGIMAARLRVEVGEFRRFRAQTIQRLYDAGAPPSLFAEINDRIEQIWLETGPYRARLRCISVLPTWVENLPPGSPGPMPIAA